MVKNQTKSEKLFIKNYNEFNVESVLVEVSFECELKDQEKEIKKRAENVSCLEIHRKLCVLLTFHL